MPLVILLTHWKGSPSGAPPWPHQVVCIAQPSRNISPLIHLETSNRLAQSSSPIIHQPRRHYPPPLIHQQPWGLFLVALTLTLINFLQFRALCHSRHKTLLHSSRMSAYQALYNPLLAVSLPYLRSPAIPLFLAPVARYPHVSNTRGRLSTLYPRGGLAIIPLSGTLNGGTSASKQKGTTLPFDWKRTFDLARPWISQTVY